MNHDAMNDSDRFSDDRFSASDEKEEGRKPFVEPELRCETGLVDGTGTTVSGYTVD